MECWWTLLGLSYKMIWFMAQHAREGMRELSFMSISRERKLIKADEMRSNPQLSKVLLAISTKVFGLRCGYDSAFTIR